MEARGKLLTCATASYEGGMIPVTSIPYFDLVNVMSYDAIGPSWGEAGAEHSSYAMAARDLDLWLARGVPRERLEIGRAHVGTQVTTAPVVCRLLRENKKPQHDLTTCTANT